MAIPKFDEPYIAVPSDVSTDEFIMISSQFKESSTSVLYGRELPIANFSGGGPPAVEFVNWLINLGPSTFRDLSLWALVTYAGKEFISGFAKDAGKDFWKGVRFLGELAFRRVAENHAKGDHYPFFVLKALGKADSGTIYAVEIDVPTADDELLFTDRYFEVQRFLLPLAGCLSLKGPEVRLRIYPLEPRSIRLKWVVWNTQTNVSYEADLEKRTFRPLSWPPVPTDITRECFNAVGLMPEPSPTIEPAAQTRRPLFWRSKKKA